MAEIIGPDGRTYYTSDHEPSKSKNQKSGILEKFAEYAMLIIGIVAIIIGLILLADIAIGLFLLFVGATSVNYWMMKHR